MAACRGMCCAVFPVGGLTYAQLEARYHRLTDGGTLFDMLRPLTPDQARARTLKFLGGEPSDLDQPLFRCVRWDEETRLCTRYDERPEMCTDYPYEYACDQRLSAHAGCDYQEPDHVRFLWLARRCPGTESWRWHGRPFVAGVTALTFPG